MTALPYVLPSSLPGGGAAAVPHLVSDRGGLAGTLHELTSHCASARALILSQYEDSPNLQALLCSYVTRVQDLEAGIIGVYERGLSIDAGEGASLDLIGRIVREARDGRADYEYRRGLRTRILVNRSQGRVPDLIAIVRLFEDLASSGGTVRVQTIRPMTIEVRTDQPALNPPAALHARLSRAKAAGVRLQTITHPEAVAGRLFLLSRAAEYPATVPDRAADSLTGLSTLTDTSRGGSLAHVLV